VISFPKNVHVDPIWNHFRPFYSKYEKKILNNYFVLDFNEKLTTSFSVKFEKRGLQPPVFVKPIDTPVVVPVSNCFLFRIRCFIVGYGN
jgi:hypothetical protein